MVNIDVLQFREGREFRLELQADQSGHVGDKNNMFAMEDKNSKQVNSESEPSFTSLLSQVLAQKHTQKI